MIHDLILNHLFIYLYTVSVKQNTPILVDDLMR